MHEVGGMFDYQYNASGVNPTGAKLELEYDDRLEQPPYEEDAYRGNDHLESKDEDESYNSLILNPSYFDKGKKR